MLGTTAALSIGRPGALARSLLIAATAYVAGGALVLRWGLDVYGARGAAVGGGAVRLHAGVAGGHRGAEHPGPGGRGGARGRACSARGGLCLSRCLLDPTLQWALVAGVAIVAAPVGAFLHGDGSPAVLLAMGRFSVLLVVWRTATAERCESRPPRRTRQRGVGGAGVAAGGGGGVAVAGLVAPAVARRVRRGAAAADERARRGRASALPDHFVAVASAAERAPAGTRRRAAGAAALPLAALLLRGAPVAAPAALQRRRPGAGAALPGRPLWLAWGAPGGVFMAPYAALARRRRVGWGAPAWLRRVALVVGAADRRRAAAWPHWPGGVRPDAWLPLPGVEMPPAERRA